VVGVHPTVVPEASSQSIAPGPDVSCAFD